MEEPYWASGLRFQCERCPNCCAGAPGYVFLSRNDLKNLMAALSLDFRAFFGDYCRIVDLGHSRALSLVEKGRHECVFWGPDGCSVYQARPLQCRTYPFWTGLIETEADWGREARYCPGINRGPLVPADHIAEWLWMARANPPITFDRNANAESIDENTILGSERIDTDPDDPGNAPK